MWLEIKSAFFGVGSMLMVVGFIIPFFGADYFFSLFVGIMGIGTYAVGEMLFGYKMKISDAIMVVDPNGPGEKTIMLFLIGGGFRFIKAQKGPLGKYEFMYRGKKASVIDDGRNPIRLPNGNSAIIAHESYDKTISWSEAKALQKLFTRYKVDDVKELYDALKKEEKKLKEAKNGEIQGSA